MKKETVESIAFYMIIPSIGFFAFSMLTWRGFYLIDGQSINPMIASLSLEEIDKLYWLNYLILALTITSLIIFIASLLIYVFSDKIKENEKRTTLNQAHR